MVQSTVAQPEARAAAPTSLPRSTPVGITTSVRGSFTDGVLGTGTAIGTTTLHKFSQAGGQLLAMTSTTLTLTDSRGSTLGAGTDSATTSAVASCVGSVLSVELGHIDVHVLDRVVHLDHTVLDITPQCGPGVLMHDLLGAVGWVLQHGAMATLAALLNRLLRLLSRPGQTERDMRTLGPSAFCGQAHAR
jgi:hypothetical protein